MSPDFGWEDDVEEAEEVEEESVEAVKHLDTIIVVEDDELPNTDEVRESVVQCSEVPVLKEAWLAADDEDLRKFIESRLDDFDKVPPMAEEKDAQADLEGNVSEAENADESEAEDEPGDDTSEAVEDEPAEAVASDGGSFGEVAGDSITLGEAQEMERRKRVLIWGPPGVGKTHNAYTSDPPIAIIDTEGKAHDLAGRFDIDPEMVRIWQPSGFSEAQEALDQALDWLGKWLEEEDKRGTIVVDSMSMIWEWAKSHYIHEYYIEPDNTGKYESEADVDLKSSMESNDPDWPRIKEWHNDGFRAKMIESPFHFLWTQMATEDFEEKIGRSLSRAPDKPHGEKDNPFKANFIFHVREGEGGVPVADCEKSGITQHTFAGYEWPTQPELFEALETIEDAETADESVPPDEIESEFGIELIKGKPSRLRGVQGGGDD